MNLIGEHTDYNDGLALPFAVEPGVTVTATASRGDSVEAVALDLGETDAFTAARDRAPASAGARSCAAPSPSFSRSGIEPPAARIEITGDLPQRRRACHPRRRSRSRCAWR